VVMAMETVTSTEKLKMVGMMTKRTRGVMD
jgi:hypothetical protein